MRHHLRLLSDQLTEMMLKRGRKPQEFLVGLERGRLGISENDDGRYRILRFASWRQNSASVVVRLGQKRSSAPTNRLGVESHRQRQSYSLRGCWRILQARVHCRQINRHALREKIRKQIKIHLNFILP